MLGGLARWLRMAGFDTEYPPDIEDEALLEMAVREGRILLTRDSALASRTPGAMKIAAMETDAQLREVLAVYPFPASGLMTRCTLCNGLLAAASRESVRDDVEPDTFASIDEFWRCASCEKVYWKGSHWEGIMRTLGRGDKQ